MRGRTFSGMITVELAPPALERIRFEPAGAFTLCYLNFQGVLDTEEAFAAIAAAKIAIGKTPPGSLRVLTDVTASKMSLPVIAALQELARANARHVTRSAVVGLSLPHRVALRQIRRLTGRDIRDFTNREDALAYLRA
jgi:stage II sporulation SpoAA-like protein